jgi:hypothetical protein
VVSPDKTMTRVEIGREVHLRATKRRQAGMNGGTAPGAVRNRFAARSAIRAVRRNPLAMRRSDA